MVELRYIEWEVHFFLSIERPEKSPRSIVNTLIDERFVVQGIMQNRQNSPGKKIWPLGGLMDP